MNTPSNTSSTLNDLLEISYLVGSVMALDDILAKVCEIAARIMASEECSIYLLDDKRERLVLHATHGLYAVTVGKVSLPVGQGIKGWAVAHNQSVAVADCAKDRRFVPLEGSGEDRFAALLAHPLRIQDEVIGVITARRREARDWAADEITLFETIGKQVAIVIEKSRLHSEKVESARLAAIGLSLSEIAHYIKNLLQGMSGGQFFVESGLRRGDLETTKQGWEMLAKNMRKINDLVQNMLNYSRSSALHFEFESLNGLLYDIASSLEQTGLQRGIQLKLRLDDTIPEMPLAYDPLHEAFYNLLTNAFDAIPEGRAGCVTVESRLDLARFVARVSVRDDGVGIAPDTLDKIFRLFYSTKGRRGTGIGLAVTKKIIEEHGGRVAVESEPGKGTTFHVELPLEQKRAAAV